MTKPVIDEVEILRFFETEPLDKATVLFNIVADKMRARLPANHEEAPLVTRKRRARVGKHSDVDTTAQPSS